MICVAKPWPTISIFSISSLQVLPVTLLISDPSGSSLAIAFPSTELPFGDPHLLNLNRLKYLSTIFSERYGLFHDIANGPYIATGIVHSEAVARLQSLWSHAPEHLLAIAAKNSPSAVVRDIFLSLLATYAFSAVGYNNLFGVKHQKVYTIEDQQILILITTIFFVTFSLPQGNSISIASPAVDTPRQHQFYQRSSRTQSPTLHCSRPPQDQQKLWHLSKAS